MVISADAHDKELAINGAATDELNAKLKSLSLERGDSEPARFDSIAIVERDSGVAPGGVYDSANEESIEGHKPGQVRIIGANTRIAPR